ncbi:MAG: M1 family metallopeptidase [Chitinophagaceae bacterium]|nr:M1 family metallopeptidase [Chitinophagaceae bacterium]
MKYTIVVLLLFISSVSFAQKNYWQQQVNYKMNVTLNDAEHSLDGYAKIEYVNNSPDTLRFIWFHLWPNAYRTDKTAFSDQLLENGRTDFYFSNKEDRGYINRLDFRVNTVLAKTEDHPQHIDIIKLILPQPLAPGASVEITTPFHVQLPKNFSRGGHVGQSYQITQWFPKPAVYDKKGWHPMPYLDQGEFYSEFGNYEVQITVPKSYVLLSTGDLQNEEEKNWLKERAASFVAKAQTKKIPNSKNQNTKNKSSTTKIKNSIPQQKSVEETKTLLFKQTNVHDFAWFADKRYIVQADTIQLSNRVVDVYSAYTYEGKEVWKNSIQMIKDAVRYRSAAVGEYPYNIVAAVEARMGFEGGMEYPCITAITPMNTKKQLESVIEHEVGHNWFQGMLANNEQRYAWLDEGINSYYGTRFDQELSRYRTIKKKKKLYDLNFDDHLFLQSFERWKKDQPLNTPSDSLTETNYFLIEYTRGADFMQLLEQQLGRTKFDAAMQNYFQQWKLKHPSPLDLKSSLEQSTGQNLDSTFALLNQKGPLQPEPKKKLKPVLFIGKNSAKENVIIFSPVYGLNRYDGIMVGAALTNYTLPATRFQYIIAPMYATRSKQLNGIARLSYTFYPQHTFQRITVAVNALKFNTDDFFDTANNRYITGFRKISPTIKFVFNEQNPRSTRERFIQWKTFFFNEDDLRFRSDTFPNGNRFTEVRTVQSNRYLNQIRFVVQDTRALYPYKAELQAEQAKDFVRLAFTGNYYLNYNEKLGANIRFFAGKFIYLNKTLSKQFSTDPYHLNMTGPKGYEDYTYSNYFVGRNEFEGFASQQIMMRDGGFKVRTDLLASKIGKTDDWLMAMNFVSDIPDQINILNILPVKIPLKLYLDIGTYADAWKTNANGSRVLYNAGLQVSFLKNIIHVYVPLLYSKVYRDYFESTIPEKRFLKNIAFSIDIQDLSLKKFDRRMPY